jgi:hypothetical protein
MQAALSGSRQAGTCSNMDDDTNDDNALMRFEFLEICVRIAFAKYLDKIGDHSDSVGEFCKKNLKTHLPPAAIHDRDAFRRDNLYVEGVDRTVKPQYFLLKAIFNSFLKPKPVSR